MLVGEEREGRISVLQCAGKGERERCMPWRRGSCGGTGDREALRTGGGGELGGEEAHGRSRSGGGGGRSWLSGAGARGSVRRERKEGRISVQRKERGRSGVGGEENKRRDMRRAGEKKKEKKCWDTEEKGGKRGIHAGVLFVSN